MPESHPHVRTLFRSSLVRILDYRCAGHDPAGEEIPQGFEIVLPRAGSYQRRDAHGTFLADPNQVLFYNMGEPYDITHPISGSDSSTVFLFAPSLLIEMLRAHNPDVENDPARLFQRSHITLSTHLQILQYRLLHGDSHAIDALVIEEDIVALTGEILRASHRGRVFNEKPSRNTLRAHAEQTHLVKTFLNAHIGSPLHLEHISSAVHLSPYHLCRVFKQNTGMTLHQYVKRLRLFNAAERMLESPAARLDLLALDFGFSNHGNFSTAFRQTFGMNPSELRGAHVRQMSKNLKA
ncbi:MAG TPA: AraC family transcriptional regulator [Anaerolineales bacterium]|nr:AraC family transcriptional regulator [Anaerolineales bacterium]